MRSLFHNTILALVAAGLSLHATFAQAEPSADQKAYQQTVTKAIEYLGTKGQSDNGSFSGQGSPAITAIVVAGILSHGRSPDDPVVAKSLKYLEGFIHDDGGLYAPESNHKNYETSVGIVCFALANKDKRYDKVIAKAEKFVKGLQWDSEEGHDKSSVNYGGAGYGKSKRPDLSNTTFLLDALKAAGRGPDDEAVQKALVFVSRCQNLETPNNTTPFAAKNPDGGFYYTPAAGGSSQAGPTEQGGLRSYGSMTYAGLKSMIFAGVGSDDPRVKGALGWLKQHYDLSQNPGMGDAGLYYYYHTFAKALSAVGQDEFVDADNKSHNWRSELIQALATRQKPDGSFVNENSRWLEGDANLVTGYALLALSYCKPKN